MFGQDVDPAERETWSTPRVPSPQIPQVYAVEPKQVGLESFGLLGILSASEDPEQTPQFPAVWNPPAAATLLNNSSSCRMR